VWTLGILLFTPFNALGFIYSTIIKLGQVLAFREDIESLFLVMANQDVYKSGAAHA